MFKYNKISIYNRIKKIININKEDDTWGMVILNFQIEKELIKYVLIFYK